MENINQSLRLMILFSNFITAFLVFIVLYCLRGYLICISEHDLHGHSAMLTGATSTLGRLIATELARAGVSNLALVDSDQQTLDQFVIELKNKGVEANCYVCDISKRKNVQECTKKVLEDFPDIDILIINTSSQYAVALRPPNPQASEETVEQLMRENVSGSLYIVEEILPLMIKQRHGHVVNISSGARVTGGLSSLGYAAAKFAQIGFHHTIREELKLQKDSGVYTTLVCPFYSTKTIASHSFVPWYKKIWKLFFSATVSIETVAIQTVLGIKRNTSIILLPTSFKYALLISAILPMDIMETIIKKIRQSKILQNTREKLKTFPPRS